MSAILSRCQCVKVLFKITAYGKCRLYIQYRVAYRLCIDRGFMRTDRSVELVSVNRQNKWNKNHANLCGIVENYLNFVLLLLEESGKRMFNIYIYR